ncbi:pseudouridine synthase [Chloroflexota bacterium]
MTSQTILKLLTTSGAGSRRKMTDAIKRGRVAINGEVVDSFLQQVKVGTDNITIDGKSISHKTEEKIYLILNKPKGIISTTSDERGRKTVIDILPKKYQHTRLYIIGRLDKESIGLLLLTNDGDFTYHLTHPKFEREKEYLAQVDGNLTTEEKIQLEKGLDLEDGKTSPARIKVVKSPTFNYSITIHEGKKHQIHRMFACLGYRVLELKRIRIDVLTIDGLSAGDTRELTPKEIQSLKRG